MRSCRTSGTVGAPGEQSPVPTRLQFHEYRDNHREFVPFPYCWKKMILDMLVHSASTSPSAAGPPRRLVRFVLDDPIECFAVQTKKAGGGRLIPVRAIDNFRHDGAFNQL